MKLIYDNGNTQNELHIYEHKKHKFRMHFVHENGEQAPTLSIMLDNGTWEQIETAKSVNAHWKNLYFLDRDSDLPKLKEQNDKAEQGFINYIKTVY